MVVKAAPLKPPPKIVVTPEKRSEAAVGSRCHAEDSWDKEKDESDDEFVQDCSLPETPPCLHHHDFYHSMGALSLQSGLHVHGHPCQPLERRKGKKKKGRHEVPLLSRIPLFDKIMAEQEDRRRIIHERNSKELRALVEPFSFTKREEEERRAFESCASSNLHSCSRPHTPGFKAKPVPKNLFSEMAYDRMREDQFYRALRKKIRADEMLKASSMPPSMEAREKLTKGKSKSLDFLDNKTNRRRRSLSRGYRKAQDSIGREVRVSKNHTGKSAWLGRKPVQSSTTDSSADVSPNASTLEPRPRSTLEPRRSRPRPRPHSALSATRSNLASVLRVQTSRNRLESAMKEKIEEQELNDRVRLKERLVRMTPAWRQLDYSTEDDLALRLAQRREEAKIRGARHRQFMDSVYGRVHQIPPLFQEPGRTHSCPSRRMLNDRAARSKSLESNYEVPRAKIEERKTRSFYLDRSHVCKSSESNHMMDRSHVCKSSESSHMKSGNSGMDSDSTFGRQH